METKSMPICSRGKPVREDFGKILRFDADAGVLDSDSTCGSTVLAQHFFYGENDRLAARLTTERVLGVGNEVHQNLQNLMPVGCDGTARAVIPNEIDAVSIQR